MRSRGSIFPLFLCFAIAFASPPWVTFRRMDKYSFSKFVLYFLFAYSLLQRSQNYFELLGDHIHITPQHRGNGANEP